MNGCETFLRAVREMRRVLKPGGSLLLTVPFGRYKHHGWQQQFDSGLLTALISEFRPQKLREAFLPLYGGEGKMRQRGVQRCVLFPRHPK